MMNPPIQKYLNQLLSDKLGMQISSLQLQPVGGGSINQTYRLVINDTKKFFLKVNSVSKYPGLFEKEKNGLEFIAHQQVIHTPEVIFCECREDTQILLLEWIEAGLRTDRFWAQFGEQLARLHLSTDPYFGFGEDNYMGALTQMNARRKRWPEFFTECRLEPQLRLARNEGRLQTKHVAAFEQTFRAARDIFSEEQPSLLHGDLWSGNFMCDEHSRPVVIDPAVYFGHRCMDLGMTTLFGGFDKAFYQAYDYYFPFPANYLEQCEVCNLYPLLIHLNLFGAGYLGQIERTLRRFQ